MLPSQRCLSGNLGAGQQTSEQQAAEGLSPSDEEGKLIYTLLCKSARNQRGDTPTALATCSWPRLLPSSKRPWEQFWSIRNPFWHSFLEDNPSSNLGKPTNSPCYLRALPNKRKQLVPTEPTLTLAFQLCAGGRYDARQDSDKTHW